MYMCHDSYMRCEQLVLEADVEDFDALLSEFAHSTQKEQLSTVRASSLGGGGRRECTRGVSSNIVATALSKKVCLQTATYRQTLQHTATHCTMLHHTEA